MIRFNPKMVMAKGDVAQVANAARGGLSERQRELRHLAHHRDVGRHLGIVVVHAIVPVERHAMPRAHGAEALAESLAVALPDLVPARIRRPIPCRELGELRLDEWQVALPCGGAQAQGACAQVRGVGRRHRAH